MSQIFQAGGHFLIIWYGAFGDTSTVCRGATGGGRPGARPPLAPERGGAQNEKKERMAKISITGTRKPIRVIVEILLYYS